jgi:hypothetical protein
MFCPNCGSEVEDGSKFCGVCGASMAEEGPSGTTGAAGAASNLTKNKGKLIKIGAGLAVVALIGVGAVLFLGNNYKKPVDDVIKLLNRQDTDLGNYIDAAMPPFVGDAYKECLDIFSDMDEVQDMLDELEENVDIAFEELEDEYGDHLKIKYTIEDKEELSKKELSQIRSFLKDVRDLLDKQAGDKDSYLYRSLEEELTNKDMKRYEQMVSDLVKNLRELKVTKGYAVEITATVKGSYDEDEEDYEFCVVKINGKWCILPPVDELSTSMLNGIGW